MILCRRVATTLVAALLLAGCAAATTPATTAPKMPVAGSGEAKGPVREVLPNGLTLLIQDHRSSDVVAVYLWVGTGVRYEKPGGLGYAHFQEHMLFKGTDTFGPGYIDRTVEGQGGRSNAFTSFDYTTFQILVPSVGSSLKRRASRRTRRNRPSFASSTGSFSPIIPTGAPCSARRIR